MLCARGGDSPNRGVGIRDRVGGERGIAGREPQVTWPRWPPPTRVCAEIKRMAAAAAAASAEDGSIDAAWGGAGSLFRRAYVALAIPGWAAPVHALDFPRPLQLFLWQIGRSARVKAGRSGYGGMFT